MDYLIFTIGVAFGSILSQFIFRWRTGYGRFKVKPLDNEEGFYMVNVALAQDDNLLKANKIILYKDHS